MSSIIALLVEAWPIVLGVLGVIGAWGWGKMKEREGRKEAEAAQAKREAKARDIADEVDNDIGALPPDKRREELRKW